MKTIFVTASHKALRAMRSIAMTQFLMSLNLGLTIALLGPGFVESSSIILKIAIIGSLLLSASNVHWAFTYNNGSKIVLPAGSKLHSFAGFVYSKKTLEMVFLPIISDMRQEYFEALSKNQIWKARWVRVRGTWSFFAAMGLDRAFAFVSFFMETWRSAK
jgi:hypothetical protein